MSQLHCSYPAYTCHREYAASYHSPGPASSVFAIGSSHGADHLEHPQWSPSYLHDRGDLPLTAHHRYHRSSPSPRYATGHPTSAYGATPALYAAEGRACVSDIGAQVSASADEAQGLSAVHGTGNPISEALLPYSARSAAAASLSTFASSPVMASSSRSPGSGHQGGASSFKSPVAVASPIPQVPTSSSMAILLNNGGDQQQRDEQRPSYDDEAARPRALGNIRMVTVPAYAMMYPDMTQQSAPTAEVDQDDFEEGFLSREKKHGCTMCHKRFDRPSTLKKHLLVHTGEKAFQCPICERRFGVMSNLNRHIRRCSLREVHTHGSAPTATTLPAPERLVLATGKRVSVPAANPAPPRKRRRRPPSPSRWVPASLRSLNLLAPEANVPAPQPLNPVSPSRARQSRNYDSDAGSEGLLWEEERDSWDENVGRTPYVQGEWEKRPKLPGPCAITKFGGALGGNYGTSEGEFGGGAGIRRRAIRV